MNMARYGLNPLPYSYDALEPVLSSYTMKVHHQRHQASYVRKLNELGVTKPISALMSDHDPGNPVYENAAQIWNHELFWNSMQPVTRFRRTAPPEDFPWSSVEEFTQDWVAAADSVFGSGYVWLLHDGQYYIETTKNAENPVLWLGSLNPILACMDVWEHAYWNDYLNDRHMFARLFASRLINWNFVRQRHREL